MFRTLIYPSSVACDYSDELPHWSYCSWFDVCWSFGVVGLEWYPCWRLKHNLLFNFTSYVLNMFLTLICPSSGACDYSVELPHWSYCSGSMCVGVSVWLGWSGILQHGYHSNPPTPKLQHTSKPRTKNSRKVLMMDILMSETCWAHKKWNKIASDIKLKWDPIEHYLSVP